MQGLVLIRNENPYHSLLLVCLTTPFSGVNSYRREYPTSRLSSRATEHPHPVSIRGCELNMTLTRSSQWVGVLYVV